MANETFTTREGKEVPIVPFTLTAVQMVSILRIKEDFADHKEHLSTYGVIDAIIDRGIKATRNYWKNSEKQKDNRDLGAAIKLMLAKKVPMSVIAQFLEEKSGKRVQLDAVEPEPSEEIDLTEEVNTLSEEDLEAATRPSDS